MPWRVGIDENGLGPQLGPLIVTAVMAEVGEAAERKLAAGGKAFLHERLDDSKALVDCHDVALGEAWARAICACAGADPRAPRVLLEALSLRKIEHLQARCPPEARLQCWGDEGEELVATDAQVKQATRDLRSLGRRGIDVVWVRSQVVCVRELNHARRAGIGRFHSDLHAMEELILAAREQAGQEAWFVCGKVGGLRSYVPAFARLGDRLHSIIEEQQARSAYRFPGIGTVSFVRDADGEDPLVALASLVGKYVRELTMKRIVRHYRRVDPSLDDASGYNDPVTGRFVRLTKQIRDREAIPEECFRREQSKDGG